MLAAAASLSTETLSMSCGFMVLRSPSMPSMSTSGFPLVPSPMVAVPRMFIVGVFSMEPLREVI